MYIRTVLTQTEKILHIYIRTYLVTEVCVTVGLHREGPPDLGDPRVEER